MCVCVCVCVTVCSSFCNKVRCYRIKKEADVIKVLKTRDINHVHSTYKQANRYTIALWDILHLNYNNNNNV